MQIILTSIYSRRRGGGGVSTHLEILKRRLAGAGHDVMHIASVPGAAPGQCVDGILSAGAPPGGAVGWSFYEEVRRQASAVRLPEGAGVLHAHTSSGIALGIRETRWPVVTSFHAVHAGPVLLPPSLPRVCHPFGRHLNRWADRVFTRVIAATSDAVVAVSARVRDSITATGAAPARLEVIPPGIDTTLFAPGDREQARKELGLGHGFTVLNVSRQILSKGATDFLPILPDLVRHIPGFQLLLIGGGPAAAVVERAAQAAGLGEAIRRVPHVDYDQMPRYYRASHVHVNSSHELESLPMTTGEAMAAGLPHVSHVAARVPGFTSDRNSLVYDTPESLRARLVDLATHPELADRLVRASRETVQEHAIARVAESLQTLYATVQRRPIPLAQRRSLRRRVRRVLAVQSAIRLLGARPVRPQKA